MLFPKYRTSLPHVFSKIACDRVHWGENCQEICECGPGASNCDTVHGCMCDSGCSGDTCSEDIDECLNTNVCGDYNKICYNTMGSFYCECREGFTEGLNGLCEGKSKIDIINTILMC